ncbi:serine/threonine protein kinase [Pedobacter frigoris]|uniref:Serine/threonine protein kinase n=1 Tax=Pedobacter frigoris TaxID=2571272 RepID=A0A4U1CJK3_9SPHI|nr:serine/threonine-protein kinase [Pedobacter frigoris]TKC06982.1 serine/threonine protein kinase [Pedobacter frigoris]
MAKVFTITEGLENMGALSTGGQGSVYKGKRMGAILSAVKLLPTPIHAENAEDKNFRDFQNEVEKLKKVNEQPCPNVVKILNSGLTESGSLPFIEMEYIEGPDLEDLLKPPHPPVFTIREAIKLADHLANALSHCHKVGVKHGDIKSNNVKYNKDTGNYVLLDFGLAVMSDEQRRSSLRHAGAVEFMAPEQHNGEMIFQSDIYSYGIILYELLAGSVPFPLINKTETSRNMVMLSHIEKQLPDVIELRSNHLPVNWDEDKRTREMKVPTWLLLILSKCLEKNPEHRFANGMELYEAICSNNEGMLSNEEVALAVNDLQNENEKLRNQLNNYKRLAKPKILAVAGVLLFAILALFAINSTFDKKGETGSVKDSIADSIRADSLKTVAQPIQPQNNPDNSETDQGKKDKEKKKNKKTKDGLVDDVPYF